MPDKSLDILYSIHHKTAVELYESVVTVKTGTTSVIYCNIIEILIEFVFIFSISFRFYIFDLNCSYVVVFHHYCNNIYILGLCKS